MAAQLERETYHERQAELRRRQQLALYQQYVPPGATILSVQDVPRQQITPPFIPLSEREFVGGYTQITYQPPTPPQLDKQIEVPMLQGEREFGGVWKPEAERYVTVPVYREALKELPKGSKISQIVTTPEGYEITYREPLEYPDLYERPEYLQKGRWGTELERGWAPLVGPTLWSIKTKKLPRWSETLAPGSFEAGFITSGEMLAETFFPYPTPRPEYHKSIFDIEFWRQPAPFIAGALTGEAVQTVVGSWVFAGPIEYGTELIKKGVTKVTPRVVKEAVSGAARSVKFSTVAKQVYGAKLWAKRHIPYYYDIQRYFSKSLARGEIGIPSFERVGLRELEIEKVVWEAMQTPRMGGVWISKMGTVVLKQDGFRVLSKVGGYWAFREVMHTPFVSQTQVTRMGIQPYIPRTTVQTLTQTTGKIATTLAGTAITTLPKIYQPTPPKRKERVQVILKPTVKPLTPSELYEQRKIQLPKLEVLPKSKKREALITVPKITTTTIQAPQQLLKPLQETRTTKITIPMPPTPTITKSDIAYPPPFRLGGGDSGLKSADRAFSKWFKKQQRIKTPGQMMETFFGKRKKRR